MIPANNRTKKQKKRGGGGGGGKMIIKFMDAVARIKKDKEKIYEQN